MDVLRENKAIAISLQQLIQTKQSRLLMLKSESSDLSRQLENIDKLLVDLPTKRTPEWKKSKHDLSVSRSKSAHLKRKLEKFEKRSIAQNSLMKGLGLFYGINESYENPSNVLKTIMFDGIKYYDNEPCTLYFSQFELPNVFTVYSARPSFKEFTDLSEKSTKFLNFIYLLVKAREYFLRHVKQM